MNGRVQRKRETEENFVQEVEIIDHSTRLPGTLVVPAHCHGIVIFAHGSGSSRLSPRNIRVADHLNRDQLGTLLFDLLTWDEAQDRENVFDIQFLASRLAAAVRLVTSQSVCKDLPLGFFGASTGAGAALWAAADLGQSIKAVVSRGGRPDLALPRLNEVTAPTLLIVGGADDVVIALNQRALKSLKQGSMVIIPKATHLFEEPGALDQVSEHARRWFLTHFRS